MCNYVCLRACMYIGIGPRSIEIKEDLGDFHVGRGLHKANDMPRPTPPSTDSCPFSGVL